MLNYAIRTAEMNAMLRLLRDLLDMRITFFDANGVELDMFDIKEMSEFCRCARRDREFDARCRACDAAHLRATQATRQPAVYHCHAGLLEGAVPLYDRSGVYVGAIVYGQYRSRRIPAVSADLKRRYRSLPVTSEARMRKVAELLQCLSQYIIDQQLIRPEESDSMGAVRQFIDAHLDRRIAIGELAQATGRSTSFIAHRFRAEYGVSPARYARKRRIEAGAKMLREKGTSVREVARRLGFCDAFHFSRVFRQEMGYAPSKAGRGGAER